MKPRCYLRPASMFEIQMRRAERKIIIGNIALWLMFAAGIALVLAIINHLVS